MSTTQLSPLLLGSRLKASAGMHFARYSVPSSRLATCINLPIYPRALTLVSTSSKPTTTVEICWSLQTRSTDPRPSCFAMGLTKGPALHLPLCLNAPPRLTSTAITDPRFHVSIMAYSTFLFRLLSRLPSRSILSSPSPPIRPLNSIKYLIPGVSIQQVA
ncbi:hypothetical protein BDN67DRAFT_479437 [Paxillus ammoniavirescens]|nr:hypothetical protein BDN67DRAFT_479437 [Paxillus ammoniavirescens]